MSDVLLIVHNYALRHNRPRLELDVIADAGMSADVICLRDEGEPALETYRTARIRRLPIRRHRGARLPVYLFEYFGFFALSLLVAGWLYVRHRHRVVIVHSLPDPLVFAALVPRLMGARVVFNMREFTPELVRTRYGVGVDHPLVRLTRLLEAASCRFADAVITVHDTGADLLARRGVPREKLTVIANTTDLPVRAVADLRDGGHARGPFTLLYHGTAGNEYDLVVVLDALNILRERGAGEGSIRLRVVGDGPELPNVRRRAAELGLERWLSLEPPVPFAQIHEIIAEADTGVALMHESPYAHLGVPTKLLECVACGVPVLSTPGGAILRYFGPDTLWYVPFGDARTLADAIEQLRADPAAAERKVQSARESLRPLLPEAMRSRFRNLLLGLAGRDGAARRARLPARERML